MKLTEQSLLKSIIEYINYSGLAWVWRINAGRIQTKQGHMVQMAPSGHSDIQGIAKNGKMVAIEVKLPKRLNTVTILQRMFMKKVEDYGGIAGVATSPEEALEIVKKGLK